MDHGKVRYECALLEFLIFATSLSFSELKSIKNLFHGPSEVEARIVPLTQLYGGKIAAALSRRHPRDMFNINHMSISFDEAKDEFIFCLLGSDRPIHKSFAPSLINQKEAMEMLQMRYIILQNMIKYMIIKWP